MSNEMADKNKPADFFNRPEKIGAWAGFAQFMWNSEEKSFMGRTGGSWGKCHINCVYMPFCSGQTLQICQVITKYLARKYAIEIFPLSQRVS
jgi:hypothetical protein